MMDFDYILANLAGAWNVMLGRPEGMRRLDTTLEGFWRSFGAILLVLPFAMLAFISQRRFAVAAGEILDPVAGRDVAVECVALVLDWIAFPIFFALVARPFGLGGQFVPFIVARNWASVIIVAMVGTVHALHLVRLIPSLFAPFLLIGALAVALRFSYFVVRLTLGVSPTVAVPIVALDFLISLTIWTAFERLV